jgi:2-oxoglutarate ferredoxin oxidoreductase subunit alpha
MNVPRIDTSKVEIDRGSRAHKKMTEPYMRYKLTDDSISPRAFPGDKGKVVVASSNVHREDGHLTEDPDIRNAMVRKSLNKLPYILKAMNPPTVYGGRGAETTLLTWGSTWGAAYEAMTRLSDSGVSINQLHFSDIYPLRTEILRGVFSEAKKVVTVEQNATSQFARLLRMEVGLTVNQHVNKYDGRQMTASFIIDHLKEAGIV